MTVHQDFAFPIPDRFSDVQAAPLLCAGAIGYRSLSLAGLQEGHHLGLTGFGASAHLVLKMVRHQFPHVPVYVFARNADEQAFARSLGAVWAGPTQATAPSHWTGSSIPRRPGHRWWRLSGISRRAAGW